MAEKIIMPKLGMMEADITLVEWLVKEGDTVEPEQALCAVESEKISNEVQTKDGGVVLKILGEEDQEYAIGTLLAIVGAPGEDISALL